MFSTPEQLSAAAKASIDSQLTMLHSLAQKTFAGFEQLVELNINVAKTSLEESNAAYKQMLDANGPQTLLQAGVEQSKPAAEKALSYAQQVAGIASGIQAEFSKMAESQVNEANRKLAAMIDDATKNAPAGSENAIAMMKAAMSKATEGYEQLTRSTKQAVETMEGTISNTVKQMSQAAGATTTGKSTSKASKK